MNSQDFRSFQEAYLSMYYLNESEKPTGLAGKFADDEGNEFSVGAVVKHAQNTTTPQRLSVSKLRHDLKWWKDSPAQRRRMARAKSGTWVTKDGVPTSRSKGGLRYKRYPVTALRNPDGSLTTSDGLNRLKKHTLQGKKRIHANVIDKADIMHLANRPEKVDEQVYIILSYLLDEGYATTQKAAEAIMVNMSEEWRQSIIG